MSFHKPRNVFFVVSVLLLVPPLRPGPPLGTLREIVGRYATDLAALERSYRGPASRERAARFRTFHEEQARDLERLDFDKLEPGERIDYLLLKNEIRFQLRQLEHEQKRLDEVSSLVPFSAPILELEAAWRRIEPVVPERSAQVLTEIEKQIGEVRKSLEKKPDPPGDAAPDRRPAAPSRVAASRAAGIVQDLRRALKRWYEFHAGYHPELSWWTKQPFEKADKGLEDYAEFLRKKLAGLEEGKDDTITGDPAGRQALLDALEHEMIPYAPEELIEIAGRELAWCDQEMLRASRDLGFGDDTRKALEHVKGLHVKPGEQPRLIKDLAEEAIAFLEARDLVTIPPLAKEIWRMEMMSPERQRVNPFFTGGEVISVSYPTDTMSHEDKLMSLRGNNIHFSRATVQHELIPGHHLQGFMAARHNSHRRVFNTPFLVEGWALYWEMLLWDLGFPRSPEDRVGMLFWRSHRCARIVFSLGFHLGKMTPQEAIDYLVERVGHERRNATAEVRRSFAGGYDPLYQAAYMLGGLQIRALRRELVEAGRMKDREFHDAVLRENAIPIEMIRASLTSQPLPRDFTPRWRFDETQRVAVGRGQDDAIEIRGRGPRGGQLPRDRVEPHWFAGNDRFWYRTDLPGGERRFILVDATRGTRGPAFDHERLAGALGRATGQTVEPGRLPIDSIVFDEDGKSVRLRGEKPAWRCDLETYVLAEAPAEPADRDRDAARENRRGGLERRGRPAAGAALRSPDGRWEAFARGHNLYLRDLQSQKEDALSSDGGPGDSYARSARRERAIELDYDQPDPGPESASPEVYWSPDSRRLVAMRHRPGAERLVYILESSPRDQVQPKLHSYPYLKPGDDIPTRKPRLFDVEAKREIPVDDAPFQNPWSIDDCRWSADSSRFTFLFNQRGHQVLRLIALDPGSGQARAIVDERSATFIDYSGKFFLEQLDDFVEIIWMSERDGWNHLYLLDARTGEVKNQITRGEWVVRGVERVDRDRRQVWFRAGGIRPGQDPYHIHHCRVNLDGTGLVVLTEGDGTHDVQPSPDRRFLIDTWSRVDLPPVTELRRAGDGGLVCELERADAGVLLAAGWRPPERFVAKGRDGVTDIYGIIHWPPRIERNGKHPVIESIYAGPQGSFVPKSFRQSYGQERLTQLGFIVVQIDGMGTSNRSKKFHDVCWRNLGDAGFPDRIAWMKAVAAQYPCMDVTRVGIYGGSAGGQNALRGLLAHGDFYKVGAADCGCHDNRMDKIWWNEQWMGWPLGPHYDECSNVTQAHRLQGKLLLTVGELDRNVDPGSTMQVVNALIKADKDFDLLVVPGAGHGAGESRYGRRRREEFFLRHLMGVEPRRAKVVRGF